MSTHRPNPVTALLKSNPLLWLLVFVPIVLVVEIARPALRPVRGGGTDRALRNPRHEPRPAAWFGGALMLPIYLVFSTTIHLLPRD